MRSPLARAALVGLAFALATVAAAVLEQAVGVLDASSVYLLAVVVAAAMFGTWAAVATSIAAFLVYDYLFTTPRFTFAVSDAGEWVSLLLFLLVAVVIGRLTASLRERADEADRRVREGVALVAISRDVALSASFEEAAAEVAARLRHDAEMNVVWVTLSEDPGRAVASAGGAVPGRAGRPWTLARSRDDGSSDWIRLIADDAPAPPPDASPAAPMEAGPEHYVVPIEDEDGPVGWIHATRLAGDPRPGRGARRLLALAGDQLGIALRRDELQADLTAAEVARQGDVLRGAILDSVSHDLRTPIASIRALAGGLSDAAVDLDTTEVRRSAAAIDAEGARLAELVNGLLDMGRIQAGALRPDLHPYDLAELVETTLGHHRVGGSSHRVEVDIPDTLHPVMADAVLFDAAFGNVVDNATRHTPDDALVRIRAAMDGRDTVLLEVDDDGPGVPAEAVPYLFDRFYRVPSGQEPARHGLGMGLAIAKGLIEAMGGTIWAESSPLGGLGIRIRLEAAEGEGPA